MASVDVKGQIINVDHLLVANIKPPPSDENPETSLVVAGHSTEIEIKNIGKRTEVPENNTARLMYYLSCLTGVVEINSKEGYNLDRLSQFYYYGCLNNWEKIILLQLCANLEPDSLEGQCLKENNDLGSPNEFYEISSKEAGFVAAANVIVAGQACQVNKVMHYKASWMETNYYEPLEGLLRELQKIRLGDRDGCC